MSSAPPASSVLLAAAKIVGARLASRGFKRKRLTFVRRSDEVVSLIQMQSSRSSTRTHATYVINYGVASRALMDGDPMNPIYSECHWRERVSDAHDVERWFAVDATDDAEAVGDRAYDVILSHVLPKLDGMKTDADLVTLWKTGVGPGLVEARRLKLLAKLSLRLGDRAEFARCRAALEALGDDPFVMLALSELARLEQDGS